MYENINHFDIINCVHQKTAPLHSQKIFKETVEGKPQIFFVVFRVELLHLSFRREHLGYTFSTNFGICDGHLVDLEKVARASALRFG